TQNENYYYRTPEHLRKLEAAGLIITTLVNEQLQGLPLVTFEDTYIGIGEGQDIAGTGKEEKVTIKGLDDQVFTGNKVVVLEGGLGWFEKLYQKYTGDLVSI